MFSLAWTRWARFVLRIFPGTFGKFSVESSANLRMSLNVSWYHSVGDATYHLTSNSQGPDHPPTFASSWHWATLGLRQAVTWWQLRCIELLASEPGLKPLAQVLDGVFTVVLQLLFDIHKLLHNFNEFHRSSRCRRLFGRVYEKAWSILKSLNDFLGQTVFSIQSIPHATPTALEYLATMERTYFEGSCTSWKCQEHVFKAPDGCLESTCQSNHDKSDDTISIEASSICLIYSHTFLCSQLFFRARSQEVLRHGEVEGLNVRLDRLVRGRFGWLVDSFPSLHRPDNAIRASPLSDKPTAWALLLGCGSSSRGTTTLRNDYLRNEYWLIDYWGQMSNFRKKQSLKVLHDMATFSQSRCGCLSVRFLYSGVFGQPTDSEIISTRLV